MTSGEKNVTRHLPPATRHLPYLYCFGCSFAAPEYSLTNKIVIKPAKTLRDFKGLLKNTKKEETFDEIRKIVKNSVGKRVIQGGR